MEMPLNASNWKNFCKKKFSNEEIFTILKSVATAVEFLHKLNFIHRDVHPSRI